MVPMKVYISHSAQDNDFVERLARAIQSDETPVFSDRHVNDVSSPGSALWEPLSTCSVFVLVLSPAALRSVWVKAEYALNCSRREGQREQIATALAAASSIIGEEQSQPFQFLEPDWLQHILVVLAQPIALANLTDDWSSLRTLEIVGQEDLSPLPEDETMQKAQEKVAEFLAQSDRLLRGVDDLSFLLADWVFRNMFDFDTPDAKWMLEARFSLACLVTSERASLSSATITTENKALLGETEARADCPPAVWCPVANVAEEQHYGPGGQEVRRGTKHFPPGAKVYCLPALWGDGYEDITVVGRHRGSHRYVKMVIPSRRLTNWRADLVYSPHVMRELGGFWDGTAASKQQAQAIVDMCCEREAKRRSEASE